VDNFRVSLIQAIPIIIIILFMSFFTYIFAPSYVSVIFIPIFAIIIAIILISVYREYSAWNTVKKFIAEIGNQDFSNFYLPYSASIYEYVVSDVYVSHSRGGASLHTFIESKNLLSKIENNKINLYDLANGNLLVRKGNGEGTFIGKILKIENGLYKGIMLIPISVFPFEKRISETIGDDKDYVTFDLELQKCLVKGNIIAYSRKEARSYKIELKAKNLGSRNMSTKMIIYQGEGGSFEKNIETCKQTVIILHERLLSVKNLASEHGKALGISLSEIIAGYREVFLYLDFIIDRPMKKDISKEVPL